MFTHIAAEAICCYVACCVYVIADQMPCEPGFSLSLSLNDWSYKKPADPAVTLTCQAAS